MSDVLLVNLNGVEISTAHLPEGPPRTNPLGILSLAATCRREGIDVEYRTFTLDWFNRSQADTDRLIEALSGDFPIIGIGCDSSFVPFLLTSLPRMRAALPRSRFVLGGYGPTHGADVIMREFPEVDVIVCGEAERSFPEVVGRMLRREGLAGIAGIRWREGDRVRGSGLGERIEDLDSLPLTPWHLVDLQAIDDATLMTSRGCPYSCPFCSIRTVWQGRNVAFGLDRVIEEVARVRLDYGIRRVRFFDDTFVLNRQRVLEFCRRLQREGLDVDWFCYARIDCVDEELLEAMASSGCTRIRFGVESASDAVLREIKGGYDAARAMAALRLSARYVRNLEVNLMYGFPFETWGDFQQTLRAAMELVDSELARVSLGRLVLYPLTPLHQKYRDVMRLDPGLTPVEFRREWRLLHDFVRRHRDLCSYYYVLPSPDLARKEQAVEDFTAHYYRGTLTKALQAASRPAGAKGSPAG